MSPYQHGEVFVTSDGAETDLDLGHYERFVDENVSRLSNVTAGQVYQTVIEKERKGDYLGGTIQVVPHITNEIKRRIKIVGKATGADVVIVEVGGTAGDIESLPFLEALRQLRTELKRRDSLYVHVTFLPHIGATDELKTKPTQHSVRELRGIGIQPNVIIARTDHPVNEDIISKIALFCDVDEDAVIPLETAGNIYAVPLMIEETGLGKFIVERLKLKADPPDLTEWRQIVSKCRSANVKLRIGIVGKYVELHDAYMSVKESVAHAAMQHNQDVEIHWIHSGELEKGKRLAELEELDGIIVPGGFGYRGIEGKIIAARYARENKVPYLGLCLGMQVMCIEYARNALGLDDANSTEFDVTTPHPVIDLMLEQRAIADLGGTMRLGEYPCVLSPNSLASQAYGTGEIMERHRHRFEFNNDYRDLFSANGVCFSGMSPDGILVEMTELQDHPFMLGCQFHPEFLSRPNRPHPLFSALIQASAEYRDAIGRLHAQSSLDLDRG
ncbi:MAG: CTP synthase, partial [Chloroflexi bacterium]|nr:CTP synthase [Chloroflexota bacterium]